MSPNPKNSVTANGRNAVAVGGDNHGTINNTFTTTSKDRPPHLLKVESRITTPITDRRMFWLTVLSTLAGVGSFLMAIREGMRIPFTELGVRALTAPDSAVHITASLVAAGILAVGIAVSTNRVRAWLGEHEYEDRVLFGRVPEGRRDPQGRDRLYLSKVTGVCAIDGKPMKPQRVPTHWRETTYSDGRVKRTNTAHQLELRCHNGRKDDRHRGKVDLTDTDR